jgi:CRP-like cAMP-binding protein
MYVPRRSQVPLSQDKDLTRFAKPWDLSMPLRNRLLATLPMTTLQRIAGDLTSVSLARGQSLYEVGRGSRYVYFPTSAIVAIVCETEDGATSETCAVGNEGMLGLELLMGDKAMSARAVVLGAGLAFRMDSSGLRREMARSGVLLEALLRYSLAMVKQSAQTAACNLHHSTEQQLSRRLLLLLDHSPTRSFTMTQETIASLLGVRRETVTTAAGKLQAAGCISYCRGRIEILDRRGLEERACECYRAIKDVTDDLKGDDLPEAALAA